VGPFYKQYRCIFGFVAQTCYVYVALVPPPVAAERHTVRLHTHASRGAQVGVAAFVVNYLVDQGEGISHSRASLMFAFCQLTFMGGRFFGAALLRFVDSAFLLSMYGFACMMCCLGVAFGVGRGGIACLYLLFFFESICYPVSTRKPSGVAPLPRFAWVLTGLR
jgi:FHS family L-fucose permease-like MFS transporter